MVNDVKNEIAACKRTVDIVVRVDGFEKESEREEKASGGSIYTLRN